MNIVAQLLLTHCLANFLIGIHFLEHIKMLAEDATG